MIDDGDPSVVATPFAEVAIFRAIINNTIHVNGKHRSSFGNNNGKLEFSTTPEILQQAEGAKGYVYVFKRENFQRLNNMEWRTTKTMKPIKVFEVNFSDLPSGIKLSGVV